MQPGLHVVSDGFFNFTHCTSMFSWYLQVGLITGLKTFAKEQAALVKKGLVFKIFYTADRLSQWVSNKKTFYSFQYKVLANKYSALNPHVE